MFTLLIAIGIMALVEAFACSEEQPEPVAEQPAAEDEPPCRVRSGWKARGTAEQRQSYRAIRQQTQEQRRINRNARRRQRYAERKQKEQSDAR